jgi:hypothetical protein
MTLRSEGRFEAHGFDRVVMIRIYEQEEGFHTYVKPWFQQTDDRGPLKPLARYLEGLREH